MFELGTQFPLGMPWLPYQQAYGNEVGEHNILFNTSGSKETPARASAPVEFSEVSKYSSSWGPPGQAKVVAPQRVVDYYDPYVLV
jgi:hypothetical protein